MLTLSLLLALGAAAPDTVLVVTNKQASTATLVELGSARVLATLPTGDNPHEVAASADGRWAVTTNYGAQVPGNSLTVIDVANRRVARTIELGYTRPHGIAFMPDHRTVAVTTETGDAILLVDTQTGNLTSQHGTGQPVSHMLALASDGRVAYTANIQPGTISRVALAGGGEPRTLRVGTATEAIALSPDDREAWLGSNNTGKVFVVNVRDWRVTDSMQTSGWPYRIGFTRDGDLALVTNMQSDEIQVFNARTKTRLGTIRAPSSTGGRGQPMGIAMGPDDRAWITLAASGEIAELDLDGLAIRRYLPAGPAPDGIALSAGE